MVTETEWLDQAVALAAQNVTDGGGPFGAIVVRDGELLASGTNQVTPTLDPTAHAEVVAIRAACRAVGSFRLDGCLLVSSCEPCPMCFASAVGPGRTHRLRRRPLRRGQGRLRRPGLLRGVPERARAVAAHPGPVAAGRGHPAVRGVGAQERPHRLLMLMCGRAVRVR